jgi:hypothetical protein
MPAVVRRTRRGQAAWAPAAWAARQVAAGVGVHGDVAIGRDLRVCGDGGDAQQDGGQGTHAAMVARRRPAVSPTVRGV